MQFSTSALHPSAMQGLDRQWVETTILLKILMPLSPSQHLATSDGLSLVVQVLARLQTRAESLRVELRPALLKANRRQVQHKGGA